MSETVKPRFFPSTPRQPSSISISGSGNFTFRYAERTSAPIYHLHSADGAVGSTRRGEFKGLSQILTPTRLQRTFARSMGAGVQRFMYTPWPNSVGPWVYEWSLETRIKNRKSTAATTNNLPIGTKSVRFIWPGGDQQISHFPDQRLIMYDKTLIQWDVSGMEPGARYDSVEAATQLRLTDAISGYRVLCRRTYRGSLVSNVHTQHYIPNARSAHPALGGLLHSEFGYSYGDNLKVSHHRLHHRLFVFSTKSAMNCMMSDGWCAY